MPDPITPDPLRETDELDPINQQEVEYFAETGMYPPRICKIVHNSYLNTIEDLTAMIGICTVGLFDSAYTREGVPYEQRPIQIGAGPEKDEWWRDITRRVQRTRSEAHALTTPERFPPDIRRLGRKVDELTLYICDLVERTRHLVFTPERLASIRAHQEELARQREERNTRRATERIERMKAAQERERQLAAARRAQTEPEHEEHPVCFKCSKRRAVSAGLCEPCARWADSAEAAKRV